ncbi:MAG TPA: DinB family protein [Saprospiraceae bacterium]|nr:DinB family protein [Saprospiraceae bacterium]
MPPFFEEFKAQCVAHFSANTPRLLQCLHELEESEIWLRPNAASNSVGNLVLHLCGNITQYVLSSLGGQPDCRDRDAEFAASSGWTAAQLQRKITETTAAAARVMTAASEEELQRVRSVQGFQMSGIGIVVHVTEHYSYHTGQIAFWTKLLKNKDLGFWADLDLNIKNEQG